MRIDGWLPAGHPGDGLWRAYLDGELPADQQQRLARHLKTCHRCQRRYAAVQAEAAWVAARLGALRAVAEAASLPDPDRWPALLLAEDEIAGDRKQTYRRRPFRSGRRWRSWVAAAAVLVLAAGLTLPSVRAWASQWITIFRAQETRTVRISEEDFREFLTNREALTGLVWELADLVDVEESADPVVEQNLTLEQLQARGFQVPRYVPERFQPEGGTFVRTSDTLVRVDVDGFNELLESLGLSERLPDGLKDQVLRLQAGRGYLVTYRRGDDLLEIVQTDLPAVSASGAVDPNQVVRAFAGLLGEQFGISAALWRQLESVDLRRAIPLPVLEGAGSTEVQVGGVTGAYHEGEGKNSLLWVADGRIYWVDAPLPKEELLRIAESLEGSHSN